MRIFIKYSFMSLLFLEAASLQICYASDNSVSSVNSDTNSMTFSEIFSRQEQQRVDEEYRGDYRNYKNKQNNLPDSQRSKVFSSNEYWLVNKEQDLWLGLFDGKNIKVPANYYKDIPNGGYHQQRILRVKRKGKISQFLLQRETNNYPSKCLSVINNIVFDSSLYTYFYSGCTSFEPNSTRHSILYDILLYDKIYDAIIVLDSIPYSTPEDLKYIKESLVSINGYYRYDALDVAFRIIAKDQIVIVDPDTGKALPKVPKTDDNGKIILINGKPVMVDDPDGYNPVILKRLP
ncbi:hypothetical protein, partial [Klebsiella pneumoniae]